MPSANNQLLDSVKERTKKITDIIDNIDFYLDCMRKEPDNGDIPIYLTRYIEEYFSDVNIDRSSIEQLVIFVADHIYRYAAFTNKCDIQTGRFFAVVVSLLFDFIARKNVNIFYILDNEIRDDRFYLTIELFELTGAAVITPYKIRNGYRETKTLDSIHARLDKAKHFLDGGQLKYPESYAKSPTVDFDSIDRQIHKFLELPRNVVYIEKDSIVDYLEQIIEIGRNAAHVCILRNQAPTVSSAIRIS